MNNFKNLQFKSYNASIKNKENKTPNEAKKDIYIEDTPTPLIKKKVLKLTANQNKRNPFTRKVLDTPTNSPKNSSKKRSNIKRLFDPNFDYLNDDNEENIANTDITLVGNDTYVTKRSKPKKQLKISNIFKPKLLENQLEQDHGCDDSFETLKRREQFSNKKIVRLSDVIATVDLREKKKQLEISNNNKHQHESMNLHSFDANSLTNITKDTNITTTMIHFNNKVTSPTTGQSQNSKTSSNREEESFEEKTSKFSNNSLNDSNLSIFMKSQQPKITPDCSNIFGEENFEQAIIPDTEGINTKTRGKSSTNFNDTNLSVFKNLRQIIPDTIPENYQLFDRSREHQIDQSVTQNTEDFDFDEKTTLNEDTTRKLTTSFNDTNLSVFKNLRHIIPDTNPEFYNQITDRFDNNHSIIPESEETINAPANNTTKFSISFNVENSSIVSQENVESYRLSDRYKEIDVQKKSYSHKKKLYIAYTNLTKMQLKILKQIVENSFKTSTKIEKLLTLKSTHLIIGNATATCLNSINPKILVAILNNCKVVKFDWAIRSSNEKKWLNEIDFVPNEYEKFFDKFFKLKLEQKCLNLFSNYESIYICQKSFKDIMREQLIEILIKSCAHITSRPNKASLIIVNKDSTTHNEDFNNDNNKTPIVSHDWVYDSIWNFQKLDINDYLV